MSFNLGLKINLWTICLIAAVLFLLISPVTLCNGRGGQVGFSLARMHAWLENASYIQAEHTSKPKPHILPSEIKENVTSSTTGSGIWTPDTVYAPGDTLIVTTSAVTLADDTHWIRIMIDGKPVVIHQLDYYHQVIRRRWVAFVEITNHADVGAGIGYNLLSAIEIDVVPAVSVSVHGDWIAPEVRFQRNIWSGVAAGAGIGHRFGESEGLHLSAGLSIEL